MDKILHSFTENFSLIITIVVFFANLYYGQNELKKRVEKLETGEKEHIKRLEERDEKHNEKIETREAEQSKKWEEWKDKNSKQMEAIVQKFHNIELALKELKRT